MVKLENIIYQMDYWNYGEVINDCQCEIHKQCLGRIHVTHFISWYSPNLIINIIYLQTFISDVRINLLYNRQSLIVKKNWRNVIIGYSEKINSNSQ